MSGRLPGPGLLNRLRVRLGPWTPSDRPARADQEVVPIARCEDNDLLSDPVFLRIQKDLEPLLTAMTEVRQDAASDDPELGGKLHP